MRILACGDQHITDRKPKNRTDKYYDTVLYKLIQEFQIAKEEMCGCIIFPGDFFDSFKEHHAVAQDVMGIVQKYPGITPFCVAGQHDQQFHNADLRGTTLGTLLKAGTLTMLSKEPTFISKDVAFYGASWNEEIPEITTPDRFNVLVIHKMIVDEKLWAAQEGHTWANHILMTYKFDLIISGDNHQQFMIAKGNKTLVNMGSMMRSTIAQINHHPAVMVVNTDSTNNYIVDLDCKPFNEVMSLEKATKEKEKNEQLDAFVTSLKGEGLEGHAVKLNFVDALEKYIETNNVEESVSDIIYGAISND